MTKRNVDSNKLMYHPDRVAQVMQVTDWQSAKSVYPIFVEISPVAHCNSRCTFCALDFTEYRKATLDYDILVSRLKEMGELGIKSAHFAGEGEPMLHPKINEIVAATKQSGIDVAFTSNGTKMDARFVEKSLGSCSWVKISLNAGSAETYSKVHRVKPAEYDKVIENIRYAVQYKKQHGLTVDIGVQSVLLPENAHEMESLAALCKEIGVDYFVVKPFAPHQDMVNRQYDNINYNDYLDLSDRVNAYASDDFEVVFRLNAMTREVEYDTCYSVPFTWAYISTAGDLLACSAYFTDPRFNLGNINTQSFEQIWSGSKRKALFEEGIDVSSCRKNCRMASCNEYLDSIKNNKIHNVNFI